MEDPHNEVTVVDRLSRKFSETDFDTRTTSSSEEDRDTNAQPQPQHDMPDDDSANNSSAASLPDPPNQDSTVSSDPPNASDISSASLSSTSVLPPTPPVADASATPPSSSSSADASADPVQSPTGRGRMARLKSKIINRVARSRSKSSSDRASMQTENEVPGESPCGGASTQTENEVVPAVVERGRASIVVSATTAKKITVKTRDPSSWKKRDKSASPQSVRIVTSMSSPSISERSPSSPPISERSGSSPPKLPTKLRAPKGHIYSTQRSVRSITTAKNAETAPSD